MVRDIAFEVDDETYARLERSATHLNMTVSEYVKWMMDLEKPRMSMKAWIERNRALGIRSSITSEDVVAAINELRGPWPGEETDEAL